MLQHETGVNHDFVAAPICLGAFTTGENAMTAKILLHRVGRDGRNANPDVPEYLHARLGFGLASPQPAQAQGSLRFGANNPRFCRRQNLFRLAAKPRVERQSAITQQLQ